MNITTMMMGLSGTAMMIREGSLAAVLSRAVMNGGKPLPVAMAAMAAAKGEKPGAVAMGDAEDPTYPEDKRRVLLEVLGVPVERRRGVNGDAVTVVRVCGPIMNDAMWAYWMGGVWSDSLAMAFRALAREQDGSPVVVVWDCPGGTVAGLTEIQAAFAELSAARPLHSLAKECMCSLAYGIGCASDTIAATPTADVGSIGTRLTLMSFVRAMDEEGVDVKNLATGKLKLYGDPNEPITEEVVVYFQKGIDDHAGEFIARVAGYRNKSVEEVAGLEAGFFDGRAGKELGLVDEVVEDPEAWILSKAGPVRPGALTAGGRPGKRVMSASATGADAMAAKTFDEAKKEFAGEIAALENKAREAGFEAGKAEGVKAGKAEAAEKPATLQELNAKFAGAEHAAFREKCALDGLTMTAAVSEFSKHQAATIKQLELANKEKSERLAALGGVGEDLEASSAKLRLENGGGGGGGGGAGGTKEDGLAPGVRAFAAVVRREVAAGKTPAQAITAARSDHKEHHMAWVAAECPGLPKK